MVNAPEPTEVAKAFATSLAPVVNTGTSETKRQSVALAVGSFACILDKATRASRWRGGDLPIPKAAKKAKKPPMTTIHSNFAVVSAPFDRSCRDACTRASEAAIFAERSRQSVTSCSARFVTACTFSTEYSSGISRLLVHDSSCKGLFRFLNLGYILHQASGSGESGNIQNSISTSI